MENLRIAIQSKGKLSDASLAFLSSLGLQFDPNGRNCMVSCKNSNLDILFLRDDDIPEYVERGIADFGIVGENVLFEKNASVTIERKLGFASCSLVIAVPNNSPITSGWGLQGKQIATSYPSLLARFLDKEKISANLITLKGSVEIAPQLKLADAICDLTQSGRTLSENNLKPIITILESQAVLIRSPFKNEKITPAVEKLFL